MDASLSTIYQHFEPNLFPHHLKTPFQLLQGKAMGDDGLSVNLAPGKKFQSYLLMVGSGV